MESLEFLLLSAVRVQKSAPQQRAAFSDSCRQRSDFFDSFVMRALLQIMLTESRTCAVAFPTAMSALLSRSWVTHHPRCLNFLAKVTWSLARLRCASHLRDGQSDLAHNGTPAALVLAAPQSCVENLRLSAKLALLVWHGHEVLQTAVKPMQALEGLSTNSRTIVPQLEAGFVSCFIARLRVNRKKQVKARL